MITRVSTRLCASWDEKEGWGDGINSGIIIFDIWNYGLKHGVFVMQVIWWLFLFAILAIAADDL